MRPRSSELRAVLIASSLLALPAATTAAAEIAAVASQPKAFVAAAGPDAEYISLADRYTLRADGAVVHERRSRLKVNSYLAINRKWGETKVPYDPAVDSFEVLANRTVLPSGAVVEAPANAIVDDQPPGAEHDPLWSGLRRKVVVHTGLESGAVIEEAWRVTRAAAAAPWLEIVEALALEPPIRSRVIEVDVPAGTPLRWQALGWLQPEPKRAADSGREVWRWTLDSVAAFPPEPGAPPEPPAIVASTCAGRAALERELARRVGAAGDAPADLVAVAREAERKNPGDEARLLAVFDAITDRVAVAGISPAEQHWAPRPLVDVWRAGIATPLELAAVHAAALRAVGFRAGVAISSGSDGRDVDRCPAFAALDRAATAVRWGDDAVRLYDPARPAQGGPLEASADRRRVAAAPEEMQADGAASRAIASVRSATFIADAAPDGALKGTLELSSRGGATPHAALVRDPSRVAREVAALLPEGKAANARVTALRRDGASLLAEVEGKLPAKNGLGLVRWSVPDLPGGVESKLPPPPAPGRQSPIALPEPCDQTLEIALALPKGWAVAALPAPATVANDVGAVTIASESVAGAVRLTRTIAVRRSLVPAAEAAKVRALLTAWASPAGREIILRPPVEAGRSAEARR